LSFLIATVSGAQEDPPFKYKEWTTQKVDLGASLQESCVSQTVKKVSEEEWTLSLVVSQKGHPNAAFFVSAPDGFQAEKITIRSSGESKTYSMRPLSLVGSKVATPLYWQMPQDVNRLYRRLRADSAVRVDYLDAEGKTKQFYFSLSGSMRNFDELEKMCALESAIDQNFFAQLEGAVASSVDSTLVNTDSLWATQLEVQTIYLELRALGQELEALQADMDPLLTQLQRELERSGNISEELEESISSKSSKQQQLKETNSELLESRKSLVLAESELEAAQAVFNDKMDAFRPVREASRAYFQSVSSSESQVASAQSRISGLNSDIAQLERNIGTLERRRRSIEREVADLESELTALGHALRDAENDYSRFDYNYELRRRMDGDSRLRSLHSSIDTKQREVDSLGVDLREARQNTRQREQKLKDCQKANQGNCSNQRDAYQSAKQRESRLENSLSSARSSLASLRSSYAYRENQIRDSVESERRKLADRVTSYQYAYRQKEVELRRAEREAGQVATNLSDSRYALSGKQSLLASARSELGAAQSRLGQAQRELADFKLRNDYDRLSREFYAAESSLESAQKIVSDLEGSISSKERLINKLEQQISALATRIEELMTEAAQNSEELRELEAVLAPLREEKVQLTQEISRGEQFMSSKASLHKGILVALQELEEGPQAAIFWMDRKSMPSQEEEDPFWNWLN